MLLTPRRIARVLVVIAAVWLVHVLAYLAAHPDPVARGIALGGHGYLDAATALAMPAAAAGLLILAIRKANELDARVHGRSLSVAVALTFLAVEIVERIPTGVAGVIDEPAVAVGLFLSLPMGLLISRLVRGVAQLLSAWVGNEAPLLRPREVMWPEVPADRRIMSPAFGSVSLRGPPALAPVC